MWPQTITDRIHSGTRTRFSVIRLLGDIPLDEVKKLYGSGPRAHDFCLPHDQFFLFISMTFFVLFLQQKTIKILEKEIKIRILLV